MLMTSFLLPSNSFSFRMETEERLWWMRRLVEAQITKTANEVVLSAVWGSLDGVQSQRADRISQIHNYSWWVTPEVPLSIVGLSDADGGPEAESEGLGDAIFVAMPTTGAVFISPLCGANVFVSNSLDDLRWSNWCEVSLVEDIAPPCFSVVVRKLFLVLAGAAICRSIPWTSGSFTRQLLTSLRGAGVGGQLRGLLVGAEVPEGWEDGAGGAGGRVERESPLPMLLLRCTACGLGSATADILYSLFGLGIGSLWVESWGFLLWAAIGVISCFSAAMETAEETHQQLTLL